MWRILVANFLFWILPLLLITVGIVFVRSRRQTLGKHHLGLVLISLPAGIFAYILAGIVAAGIRGDGHFFSFPFGGYRINDNGAIVASAITWIALVFIALNGLWTRKEDRREGERPLP